MAFIIDTKIAEDFNLSKGEFYYLLGLYFCSNADVAAKDRLLKYGYINNEDKESYLSPMGERTASELIMYGSDKTLSPKSEYKKIAKAITELYPRGFKPETHSLWRGSIDSLTHRLITLQYISRIKITKELAVKVVKEYINTFKDYKYMQTLPCFLYKVYRYNDGTTEWSSQFLSTLEHIMEEGNS